MNKQELKSKIEKLEKGLASKVTPENLKASLKSQKAKFEKELTDLEAKEKKDKAAVSDKIKALKDKVKSKVSSITRDGARKAKAAGKRIAEDGSVYYEKRANRTDSQTKKKPYLEKGGSVKKVPMTYEFKAILRDEDDNIKEKKEFKVKATGRDSAYNKAYKKYPKPYFVELYNSYEKGGDLYDDMNDDIEFANKKAKMVANSLKGMGYNIVEFAEADYDTDANISLSENVNVNVDLEGELAVVVDEGDGKFLFMDCGKSYATVLEKLKKLEKKGLVKRNTMEKGGKAPRTIKLTLSDKDSYDYTYKQDGTTGTAAEITFGFGKEPFQYEVKKISKSLEPLQQDILDAFTIQGIKQHEYKGGFSEAIKHLDTKVVYEDNFANGGELEGMTADIFRSDYDSPTNKMYGKKSVTIIDKEVPKIFEPSESAPAVRLIRRNIGWGKNEYNYIHAIPYDQPEHRGMFGGTFIYSSDSRFPAKFPIPLHDRVESYKDGGKIEEIDMEKVESSAKFYTDESKWTDKPTIKKFEDEIKQMELLKNKLDNKEITPSKIIGTGFKTQYARPLAYRWLNERILIAKRAIEILKEREGKMAAGGELNLGIRKMAQEDGFTPKELGKEYQLVMGQAVVEALTDANNHSEARKLVSILEKNPKIAEKPDYPSPSDPKFKQKMADIEKEYGSEYWDADEKTRAFGVKVSQKSGWDGYAIAGAFEYLVRVEGGYHKLADAIEKAMESSDEMANGGKLSNEEYDKLTREYDKLAALAEDAVGEEKEEYKRELEKVAQKIHREERGYAKGGGIYSSDSLYYLQVLKDGEEVGREKFRAKNLKEAREIAEDDYEKEYQSKFGDHLSFIVSEAMPNTNHMAKGGTVKYYDKDNEYKIGRPSGYIEKDILERVSHNEEEFVGSFGWKTSMGKMAEGYLYNLNDFDKNLVKDIKLKQGEKIFRYLNRTTAIGGMRPFIKINVDKSLLYFLVNLEDDGIEFETKGVQANYVALIADKMGEGGYMAKGGDTGTNKKIKDFYVEKYPMDELGIEINEESTFDGLYEVLDYKGDVYHYIGVSDSLVRERVFEKLSELKGVDYDVIYQKWLDSDDEYANGGETSKNISVFGYDTLNFDICPIAREEFEKAMTALEGGSDSTKVALSRAAMYVDDVFGIEKQAKAKDYVGKGEFEFSVNQSLVAASYNYAAGFKVNLFKFMPMHISEIASKLVYVTKNEDKDDLTAYDLLVAKDKVGEAAFKNMTVDERRNLARENKESFAEGGSIEEGNYRMVVSQAKAIKHHADELLNVLTPDMEVEAWVVGKIERASTDLSDITHYIDGFTPNAIDEEMDYSFEKGGQLEKGVYYLGKPTKEGSVWAQKIVELDEDGIYFATDYARKLKDFPSKDYKKLSAEELSEFIKNSPQGKNLSPDSAKWGYYAAGGMIVGRWYKDNQGVEHRYIGENRDGQPLFSDGQKVAPKSLDDFESDAKETKLFKWFKEGGEIHNFSNARLLGRESQDWESEARDYVGADWDNLSKDEKEQIISDIKKSFDRNTHFGRGGLTKNETLEVAERFAKAIAKADNTNVSVNMKTIEEDSFDLDMNGIEYDGGSYSIYSNGDVKNMALSGSPVYGKTTSSVEGIVENLSKKASGGFTSSFSGTPDRRRVTMAKGGSTKNRKSIRDLKIEEISSMTGLRKEGIERFSDENELTDSDLSNIMQGLGRKMISSSDFSTAVLGNKNNSYAKEIVDFAKSGKGYKLEKGGKVKFEDKVKAIKASLLKKKKVSPKVQKDYGKTYNSKEAEQAAKRIVGSMRKKGMK